MSKTRLSAMLAGTAITLTLGQGIAQAQTGPIQLGAIVSISGSGASIGQVASIGWRLAVDEINASGGILGRQVVLTIADSQTDPTHAVSEARRLVENVGIEAMVGPVTSQEVIPVTSVTTAANIAQFTTAASPALTPEVAPYHFSNSPTGVNQMIAAINYAVNDLGLTRIALISDNGGMSVAAVGEIAEYMTSLGVAPIAIQEFAFRAEDMTPQIFSLRSSGAEAVLLINSIGDDARKFLQNRDEIGWDALVLGSLTTTNYAVSNAAVLGAEAFENVYSVQFSGMTYCPGDAVGENPFAQFTARAVAAVPNLMQLGGASAIAPYYVEPYILQAAAEGAGTLDGAAIAAWVEANAATMPNILGEFGASSTSHFLPSSNAMVVVRNPHIQREDGLVERVSCN